MKTCSEKRKKKLKVSIRSIPYASLVISEPPIEEARLQIAESLQSVFELTAYTILII